VSDLADWGLWGLFLAAFLAGSILPFSSEAVLGVVVAGGRGVGVSVAVATAGNVLGALSLYAMGWAAERGLLRGRLRERLAGDEERLARARARIARWGSAGLLLAWVPIVGDAFVLGAGLAGVRLWLFTLLVTVGKGARYAVVAHAAAAAAR
jgi:membrane protein YqaA with SNARE-associated domain